jgi:DNA-binding HxlR family transcriptional regulator
MLSETSETEEGRGFTQETYLVRQSYPESRVRVPYLTALGRALSLILAQA